MATLSVGIAMAQATFTAACRRGGREQGLGTDPNTPAGFAALADRLDTERREGGSLHLVREPTAGYALALVGCAGQRGWPVSLPNPKQVRDWARGIGRRATSDALATVLAPAGHCGRGAECPGGGHRHRRRRERLCMRLGRLTRMRESARAIEDEGGDSWYQVHSRIRANGRSIAPIIADQVGDSDFDDLGVNSAMDGSDDQQHSLQTPTGVFPLHEYHLREAGRAWAILHAGAVLSHADEARAIGELRKHLPYGLGLWPSAIGLAHEVITRADGFRDKRVLELGAGTGLPGIVAASLGGRVVQTDRDELAMSLCRRNGARNDVRTIEYRLVDWAAWDTAEHYDWIIGADILYGETTHPLLRRIFTTNLAPGGRILLADPFRATSLQLLESLEAEGWTIVWTKWNVGEAAEMRPVGLFELIPPR